MLSYWSFIFEAAATWQVLIVGNADIRASFLVVSKKCGISAIPNAPNDRLECPRREPSSLWKWRAKNCFPRLGPFANGIGMSNAFSKSKRQATPPLPQTTVLSVPPQSTAVVVHSLANVQQDWPNDDVELVQFGTKGGTGNHWCLKDAFEGVQIFGGTGSGKTSGSGKTLAKAFIAANLGGLVLTAKRDEAEMWIDYLTKAGRIDDLVIFPRFRDGKPEKLQFNFLRYAFEREKGGAGRTENLVNLFCSVLEVGEKKGGGGGGGNDAYWQRTLKQLLRNAIDLSILALNTVNLEVLHGIVYSAPATAAIASLTDPVERKNASDCLALIDIAAANQALTPAQQHDLKLTRDFWEKEFPNLAIETRSVIVSTFTSMADCFLRGTLYDLFCTELNIYPEECWEQGKIILLDLPVKEYYELGQFGQVIFKYLWQRSVERRVPISMKREEAQQKVRPVFLWADEAQFFANSYDAQFQSTARSSRACTVYLTQNLPSYHSVFGGANAKADADMFLGNLVTKIFHANGDSTTNAWAADTIGKERQFLLQAGSGPSMMPGKPSNGQTSSISETISYAVEPQVFTMLQRGGPPIFHVDGIIFQSGRTWINAGEQKNYVVHSFDQTI